MVNVTEIHFDFDYLDFSESWNLKDDLFIIPISLR